MTATRPMCRNIAATSPAEYPDAKTAQVDPVIKLLIDGHSKLTLMLVNALAHRGAVTRVAHAKVRHG
jgi:hypothetical protein